MGDELHKMYIYKITNVINNKVYIGQTVDFTRRVAQHKLWARKMYKEYSLYVDMDSYGIHNFTFDIVQECDDLDANAVEKSLIQELKSYEPEIGYNENIGDIGHKFKPHTLKKMSETQVGDKNHMYNMRGNKNSRSKSVVCTTTGEHFESVMLASEYYSIPFSCIARVCRGERKTTGGLAFEYINRPDYVSHKAERQPKVVHNTYEIISGKCFNGYHIACREYNIDYSVMSSNLSKHGFYYDLDSHACFVLDDNKAADYIAVMGSRKNSICLSLEDMDRYYFNFSDVFRKVYKISTDTALSDCEGAYRSFVKRLRKNKCIRENGYEIAMLTV